jgi:hypothetical protein
MQCACAVLYCHLCPVWQNHIFFTLSHKRHGFSKKKKLWGIKCVFWFSLKLFCLKLFSFKKNSGRYYHKCTWVFKYSAHYSFLILMTLVFSWHISFFKISNSKFHENPASCSVLMDRQADRQTDMTKLIINFCNFANAPKIPLHESLKTNADVSVARITSNISLGNLSAFPYL